MKLKFNIHFILISLAASLWGIAGIFVRTLEETAVSQMQLVFGRAIFSSLILGVIILFKDKKLFKIKLKDIWVFVCAGLFSIILFNFAYYTTMSLTSLSVAAVLLYTAPFFVVIISLLIFGEKLTSNKTMACITAFLGCCMVSGLFDAQHRVSGKAIFWGLLTGFGYALYTVFGEIAIRRGYKTLTITFYVFLFAAVFSIVFINPVDSIKLFATDSKILITVFLMALLNTVIPYLLYTVGLTGVEPSVAPIIATVEPVVATIVGVFIFKENISLLGVLGIGVVLMSVAILNFKPLSVKANAKINLSLVISGKREDGYHFIDTVMQSITLCDTLEFKKAKKITVKCNDGELNNEENIAYKAAKLFFEKTGIMGGVTIKIKKRIPKAAGLGGGSADGAAVLVALNRLYNANLSDEKLEEYATTLGADVPFFIKGGTQRAEGIGEILTKLADMDFGYFVLAKADSKPSTAEMYRKLDSEEPISLDTESVISAIENSDADTLSKLMDNSFASVWKENKLQERLLKLNPDCVCLSGSGPVWFAFYKDYKDAKTAFKILKKEKIQCYFAKPCKKGMEIE